VRRVADTTGSSVLSKVLTPKKPTDSTSTGGVPWRPRGTLQWIGAMLVVLFIIGWAVLSLLPMMWMFTSAFTPSSALVKMPPQVSIKNFSIANFTALLKKAPLLPRWFLNTALIASVATVANLIFDTMAGYAFAKMDFPGRELIFWAILSTMMIPSQVTLVPMFLLINKLHWYDSYAAILVPGMCQTFGIFMMKQFIQTLPADLEDAARVDGCSEIGIWWRIILPLCKPGMAVLGISIFMGQWKSFLWPLIVLKTERKFLLEQGLTTLQQQFFTDYGVLMSGAALAAIPMIIVFFFFQRYLIEGVTVGDVLKG
jgi:multiple sugar transport system permease protein